MVHIITLYSFFLGWVGRCTMVNWMPLCLPVSFVENGFSEEVDVDDLLVALKHKTDSNTTFPTCVASVSFSCRYVVSPSLDCYFQAFFTTVVN